MTGLLDECEAMPSMRRVAIMWPDALPAGSGPATAFRIRYACDRSQPGSRGAFVQS